VKSSLVVDRRGPERADQRSLRATRGAPQLETGPLAEYEQRLPHGANGSLHEHALALLDPGRAVKELVGGRPAQDQGGRLGRIDARRHAGQVVGP
jgi:hypothetical protein